MMPCWGNQGCARYARAVSFPSNRFSFSWHGNLNLGRILEWYYVGRLIEKWKQEARNLRIEVYAIYLAYKDSRVPLYARVFAGCVVAYAFSPIDLIPDPIPILGYLDDLVLIPLGVMLAVKMIPKDVMRECRKKARELIVQGKPSNKVAAVVIICIWLFLAALCVSALVRIL